MTFRKVIQKCDNLFPNQFSSDEKLKFLNELSALIHTNYIIRLKRDEFQGSETFSLPDHISTERIRKIYFDGSEQSGESIFEILKNSSGKKVCIEYIDIPQYNLDDKLPVSAPYDEMFTYWLLAKVCLHNEDAQGYSNYMNLYNALLYDYKKCFGENNHCAPLRFKNLW